MKKNYLPIYFSVAALMLTAALYIFADRPLAVYCKDLPRSITDIAEIVTVWGEAKWYLIGLPVLTLLFYFVGKSKLWAQRMIFIFAAMAVSGLINTALKWLAGRHRPINMFNHGFFGFTFFGSGYELSSFPSGHSVTAFSLAAAIGLLFPRLRIIAYLFATAIAGSRIILTSHFLSDTVAGAMVGIMITLAVKHFYDWKKISLSGQ